MTAERLEIIAGSGKLLNSLILISEGKKRTIVEGDFLSSGIYHINIECLKGMIRLKAKKEYGKAFEIKYSPITNYTQNNSETKVSDFIHQR